MAACAPAVESAELRPASCRAWRRAGRRRRERACALMLSGLRRPHRTRVARGGGQPRGARAR
eukprot:7226931-Prymnesium_polylepis.2